MFALLVAVSSLCSDLVIDQSSVQDLLSNV
jgi:hypothetical protein